MKTCIVNYITDNAWFPFGQRRLEKSLKRVGFKGDILLFNNKNFNCVSHFEIPYAFKFYCLKEAEKRGYELILWVDASFWAIQEISSLFKLVERKGLVLQNSGYSLGQWSSDNSLKLMKMNREETFSISMFSGGFMGYNLTNPIVKEFLNEFYKFAVEGTCFKGEWVNDNQQVSKDPRVRGHRHDMVVGSILAHRMGLNILSNNTVFSYYGWYEKYKQEIDLRKVSFVCEGGTREI